MNEDTSSVREQSGEIWYGLAALFGEQMCDLSPIRAEIYEFTQDEGLSTRTSISTCEQSV